MKKIIILAMILFMIYSLSLSSQDKPEIKVNVTLLHYSQLDVENNPQIKVKSQGVPTVPVGQMVYLKAKTEAKQITGYQWSLETPAGSKAGFNDPAVPDPTLVPDLEGQYKIKLSVTSKSGATGEDRLWLTAAAFVGDGLLVKAGSQGQCIHCHEEKVKTWKATSHASNLQESVKGMTHLKSGQCESCHGPGSQHMEKVDQHQISSSMSPGICAVCHDSGHQDNTFYQWSRSQHGQYMNANPMVLAGENRHGCARCHFARGYIRVILNKQESKAPYKDKTGISCAACHDPHDGDGKDSLLRAGKVENACNGCHDLLMERNMFGGFVSYPQGLIVKGKAGQSLEGETIPSGKHSQVEKNCVGCHMAKSPSGHTGSVGGHTFRVISNDKKNPVLNVNGCLGCHDSMSLELIRNSQEEIKKLLKKISASLPQLQLSKQVLEQNPWMGPKFFVDPSLTKIQSMASANYYLVVVDKTFGIHNPIYIKKLLDHTIKALETENAKKKPTGKKNINEQ
jgi:predicted CXXCH cytochrome family protein